MRVALRKVYRWWLLRKLRERESLLRLLRISYQPVNARTLRAVEALYPQAIKDEWEEFQIRLVERERRRWRKHAIAVLEANVAALRRALDLETQYEQKEEEIP